MRKIVELSSTNLQCLKYIIYKIDIMFLWYFTICFLFSFVKVGVLGEVESYAKVLYEILYIYIYIKPSNKRNVTNTD